MLFRQKSRISSYLLALGLVAVMLPMIGLAEPHVWPAWRAMTAQGKEFSSRQLDGKVVVSPCSGLEDRRASSVQLVGPANPLYNALPASAT